MFYLNSRLLAKFNTLQDNKQGEICLNNKSKNDTVG